MPLSLLLSIQNKKKCQESSYETIQEKGGAIHAPSFMALLPRGQFSQDGFDEESILANAIEFCESGHELFIIGECNHRVLHYTRTYNSESAHTRKEKKGHDGSLL